MRKRLFALFLTLALALTLVPTALAAGGGTAYARTQQVELDGEKVTFEAYALKDPATGYETNYVKLRDVALALNGTPAQFEVGWDGAVNIVTGQSYTANGSENQTPWTGDRAYTPFAGDTRVNGVATPFEAITLTDDNGGGYTYYKLRDLGTALGFGVDWTAERGIIVTTGADDDAQQGPVQATTAEELLDAMDLGWESEDRVDVFVTADITLTADDLKAAYAARETEVPVPEDDDPHIYWGMGRSIVHVTEGATLTVGAGVGFATDGDEESVLIIENGGTVAVAGDGVLSNANGCTVTVKDGGVLRLDHYTVLYNEGTLTVEKGGNIDGAWLDEAAVRRDEPEDAEWWDSESGSTIENNGTLVINGEADVTTLINGSDWFESLENVELTVNGTLTVRVSFFSLAETMVNGTLNLTSEDDFVQVWVEGWDNITVNGTLNRLNVDEGALE